MDAIKKITSLSQLEKIDTLFPNEILNAKKIVEECPVNMGGEGAISFLYHLIKEKKSEKIINS